MPKTSRRKAQHVKCQTAVDNVKADLMQEIARLRAALQKQQDVEDHSLECLYCLHDDPCTDRDRLVADAGVARADVLGE